MGMRFSRYILALVQFAMLLSCGKEGANAGITQPDGFRDLIAAYQRGDEYRGLSVGANTTHFRFGEDEVISIPISQILVYDCDDSTPRVVGTDMDGQWTVGGRATGVYRDERVADIDAIPVYAYHRKNNLHLFLSNGNHLEIKYVSKRTIVISDKPAPESGISLPVVRITTVDRRQIYSTEEYVEGTVRIESADTYFWNVSLFEAPMKIRGRGNSTWTLPKKPFKIKLEEKAELFGMPGNKDWCLIANYSDKSLLRNRVAMRLSEMAGFSWTPKNVPVEVYLNDEYLGAYDCFEHKEVAKNKVDIDVKAGDMYFEIEGLQDEPVSWWTYHGVPMMFKDPEHPAPEQVIFAKQFFQDFEDVLWAGNFGDRSHHYSDYIDVDSFVNYFIVEELTKDVDGDLAKSAFLTLKAGGKLEMYHLWDFDLILGNCNYYDDGLEPWEGWWIKDRLSGKVGHGWYYHLFMDPEFVAKVKVRWAELYSDFLTIPGYIDAQVEILGDAPARNFDRWPILNEFVWPNVRLCGSYGGEVDWLKECYVKRLEWLNREIPAL